VLAEAKRAQFVERLKEWRANNSRSQFIFRLKARSSGSAKSWQGTVRRRRFRRGLARARILFSGGQSGRSLGRRVVRTIRSHPRRLLRLRRAERHRAQIDFSELAEGRFGRPSRARHRKIPGAGKVGQRTAARGTPRPEQCRGPNRSRTRKSRIEFADEAKLYVPLEQAYLVSRYVGAGKKSPPQLARRWQMGPRKNQSRGIHFRLCGKMLAIQPERQMQPATRLHRDTNGKA
jgi:transcription-repair coupling factor (superfamily II helicase)